MVAIDKETLHNSHSRVLKLEALFPPTFQGVDFVCVQYRESFAVY